mmetsp:Transcript_15630/g.24306  ORF Transcript_15630/g.24306 Transcript_15630/m.24306 type:complete len:139 (-) Transcript_15630:153-569(-)
MNADELFPAAQFAGKGSSTVQLSYIFSNIPASSSLTLPSDPSSGAILVAVFPFDIDEELDSLSLSEGSAKWGQILPPLPFPEYNDDSKPLAPKVPIEPPEVGVGEDDEEDDNSSSQSLIVVFLQRQNIPGSNISFHVP